MAATPLVLPTWAQKNRKQILSSIKLISHQQSIDNSFLSSHKKLSAQFAEKWPSYGQKTYADIWIIGDFREFLACNLAKSQYFSMRPGLFNYFYQVTYYLHVLAGYLKKLILYPENPKNFHKVSHISVCPFCPIAVTKTQHILHFPIFSLENSITASQLTFRPDYWISFMAPFFSAIFPENCAKMVPKSKFKNPAWTLAAKLSWEAVFKISSENCRAWCFFSDRD